SIQVLPTSERMSDFLDRIEELIGALSVLEDRHPCKVLDDMLKESATHTLASKANGAALDRKKKPLRRR
ncbi:MAG TPA: hypothetical protein VE988_19455, partial [Gemmataceae bacterium]|nr:hypothetical protein [Gemmataceae bacterium]